MKPEIALARDGSSRPLVTVIIPTYHSPRTLRLALKSVLAQDMSQFEVWIVGDGCTDESESVVNSFGDQRLNWVNLPANSGSQGAPNNEGLRRARGKYVAYLGHDDLWFPSHLTTLVKHIEETGADLVHGLNADYSPGGALQPIGPPPAGRSYAEHFVCPTSWLHRLEIIKECGYWADHLEILIFVDREFLQRIARAGKRIEYCPDALVMKFASGKFRIYDCPDPPPQQAYFEAMQADPQGFRTRILTEIATAWSVFVPQEEPYVMFPSTATVWRALRATAGFVGRKGLQWYGYENWPLSVLVPRVTHYRYQKWRQRAREPRGLKPYLRKGHR